MAESDTSVNKVIFDSGYSFPDGSTTLTISRDVPAEQDLDLRNGDDMDAEDIEEHTRLEKEMIEEMRKQGKEIFNGII